MDDGYILIHRKIINWQWYSNKNDRLLFIHCLISANWKDGWFNGEKIPRGSFATSLSNLSKECGLTLQQTRTSLNHLKSTNELTHHTNKQFSIITINNYDKYQTINTVDNKRITNEQQTINNNRIKEIKEINIKESISKDIPKKSFKKPLLEEIQKYCQSRNNDVDAEKFYDYYEANDWIDNNGKKVKNWKQKIITWEGRKKEKEQLPDWFDNEPKERKRTEDEERELQELIRGNKR